MYSKHPEIPEELSVEEWIKKETFGQPIGFGSNDDIWFDDVLSENDDDNTGGISPTPRPKRPTPSPKTNDSATFPD